MSEQLVRSKSKRLSLDQRIQLLNRLEAGESGTDLADAYGITKSAVSWIKKNKENSFKQKRSIDDAGGSSSKKKRYSGVEESPLEKALYLWVVQKRSIGEAVSGLQLQQQALTFNEQLNGSKSFMASTGFLHRFKQRHGLSTMPIQGGKPLLETEASDTYCEDILEFLTEGEYGLDLIYNADETGLYWKNIPNETLERATEQNASEENIPKDRVTLMVCTNASGSHKLPLMVVGRCQKPKSLQKVKYLPVTYKAQKSGWMNRELTMQWYAELFLPEIERVHGPNAKCVLLLDNAPSHPSVNELNVLSERCVVKYLPPKETSLIQPMGQGIIEKLKRNYKKNLLCLLRTEDSPEDVKKLLGSLNIYQCCNFVASAWENVTSMGVRNAWKNVFPMDCSLELIDFDLQADAFLDLVSEVPGLKDITLKDIHLWLQSDNDPGWKILTDQEILAEAHLEVDEDFDGANNEDNELQTDDLGPRLLAKNALRDVDAIMLWYQCQWECTPESLLTLDRIRRLSIEHIVAEKNPARKHNWNK